MTDQDLNSLQPVHNPAASRFEIELGDQFAVVDYDLRGETSRFTTPASRPPLKIKESPR